MKTRLNKTIKGFTFVALLITIYMGLFSIKAAFGDLLPIRGLTVQFERRGWASGYYPGDVIHSFNNFDPIVGRTVASEIAAQLDIMKQMGVNTITYELRAADPTYIPPPFVPPDCNEGPSLGVQYPQPTSTEINNLTAFFDLVNSKGIKIILMLNNTHMEEQPPVNNATWIGSVLNVIKDHPALELVVFGGNTHLVDNDGDGVGDACGIPAEAPLYIGPTATPAQYVKWAINYAQSLGVSTRKLSAEAIIGDFNTDSQTPAGPTATDGHLWPPIVVLKGIFDQLSIPNDQRTYAISFYEHRKCLTAPSWLPCVDKDPHAWADETLHRVFDTIGQKNGSRVIAVEMGLNVPVDPTWTTEQALESIISLMSKYRITGGTFWRWASSDNSEDSDPQLASPIKRRGEAFTYNPIKNVLETLYTVSSSTLSPPNYGFSPLSGTGIITVTPLSSSSSWTATSNDSWIHITAGWTGQGNGTVSYYVDANTTGIARNGTITIGVQTFTVRQAASYFVDDPQNALTPYIYAMSAAGITHGCNGSSESYCISDPVTRSAMAVFIIRALYGDSFDYTQNPYFTDVPPTYGAFSYIQKFRDIGITQVTGTYDVNGIVTRGQMAVFLVRAFYGDNFDYTQAPYFTDVPPEYGAFKYIQKFRDTNITQVTGTYNVDVPVTRDQMAVFLSRAFLSMQ